MRSRIMRHIIGLAGCKRVGKDTCADFLVAHHGFLKYSLADPIKEVCKHMFLFDDEQLWGAEKDVVDPRYGKSPREVMQRLGTDFVRDWIGDDFWINRMRTWADSHNRNIVVADVRFQNEVDAIHAMGGHVLLLSRPSLGPSIDCHKSEACQLNLVDVRLENKYTVPDLQAQLVMVLQELWGGPLPGPLRTDVGSSELFDPAVLTRYFKAPDEPVAEVVPDIIGWRTL